MDARTPHAAVAAFQADISLALSCVTQIVPQVERFGRAEILTATIAGGHPVSLKGAAALHFGMVLQYRLAQDSARRGWAVQLAAYEYKVLDEQERELLVYHWHPEWRSQATLAHLHLGSALLADSRRRRFAQRHLPTALVALEDVLWLLIEELSVQPIRDDWRERLTEIRGRVGG